MPKQLPRMPSPSTEDCMENHAWFDPKKIGDPWPHGYTLCVCGSLGTPIITRAWSSDNNGGTKVVERIVRHHFFTVKPLLYRVSEREVGSELPNGQIAAYAGTYAIKKTRYIEHTVRNSVLTDWTGYEGIEQ